MRVLELAFQVLDGAFDAELERLLGLHLEHRCMPPWRSRPRRIALAPAGAFHHDGSALTSDGTR